MDLCNESCILDILTRHGFRFSKNLGQNFLTAAWVPARIAEESGITETDGVIEVGPGIGCLTKELSAKAGRVAAVELDKRLIPVLDETLRECGNVSVINADIMKLDLAALVREQFGALSPAVCANLPYNITTPVLTRLVSARLFPKMTVMIQAEAARRICAGPKDKDYCAFSVFMNYFTEPQILFDVPPSCFTPAPKVTSSVISLPMRTAPVADVADEKLFFRVVNAVFSQRRKTLVNSLASALVPMLTKDGIAEAIRECGFEDTVRGETLGIPEFAALTAALSARIG